ncbi:MAG TPA: hypothetical protein VLJ62_30530 [Burkholderiaceae bacterium]|nr:hypothetical protein [Burkholderiaceae bacterium]
MNGQVIGAASAWKESDADACALNDAVQAAIAEVLAAERDARDAIGGARREVNQIDEAARAAARAVAERTERRVRAVVHAFEHQLACQLAAIDAQASSLDVAQPLADEETAALQRAVRAFARKLIGAQP